MNTMPSWQKNHLSQDSGLRSNHESGKHGDELDENGHLIKSSKMFDSAATKSLEKDSNHMKTIPQSDVENSQLLGSEDFTGEGA